MKNLAYVENWMLTEFNHLLSHISQIHCALEQFTSSTFCVVFGNGVDLFYLFEPQKMFYLCNVCPKTEDNYSLASWT